MSKQVKVQGTDVVIPTGSGMEAREVAAAAERDRLRREAGWIGKGLHIFYDGLDDVTAALGRGTFSGLSYVLMLVGVVIAFISWGRLFPLEHSFVTQGNPQGYDIRWVVGLVGVAVVIYAHASAGRLAKARNEREDALNAKDALAAMGAERKAEAFWNQLVACLVVDALAAFAFTAAVTADAKTGRIDYDTQISDLKRAATVLEYEADDMPRPPDDLAILQEDLQRLLKHGTTNNSGTSTGLSVAQVTGWGVDEKGLPLAEPGETYCLPGGKYASYVDRYCPDLADAHRKVRQKEAWLAKLDAAAAKRAEAKQLEDTRPDSASAMALGETLGKGNALAAAVWKALPSVALMAIILILMTYSAYTAKRDPKGVVT